VGEFNLSDHWDKNALFSYKVFISYQSGGGSVHDERKKRNFVTLYRCKKFVVFTPSLVLHFGASGQALVQTPTCGKIFIRECNQTQIPPCSGFGNDSSSRSLSDNRL
jgi:hypothetical protein